MGATGTTTVVVIGGGHNGLAMSKQLGDRGIDHVVLERGEIASSWRTQRWDSFTLLTPNWQTRLPGAPYDGDDPDGFMTGAAVAELIAGYGSAIDAPVLDHTTVTSVRFDDDGYRVDTDQGAWRARAVVLAGGACNRPAVPTLADALPADLATVNPLTYRNPDELPDGGVLVVGGAATGIQLAEEIHASGRPVILSVGEHVRMPRTYRGHDIQHWMEAIGRLDERFDEVDDLTKARATASPQLVGTPERRDLDVNALVAQGVQIRGRLGTIRDGVAMFSGGLRNHCALADQKLQRLLDDIDTWIEDAAVAAPTTPRPGATEVPANLPLTLDLSSGEIATVVWATGFRPDLSWVDLPVFDAAGRLRHDGGVVAEAPGLYALGLPFLRRRRSTFIHGCGPDTAELADHLVGHLAGAR